MAKQKAAQTELESRTIKLSTKALQTFCDDLSGMFAVEMDCQQQDISTETIKGLKKHFEEPAFVNSVKAEGFLNGDFQIVLSRQGLFTLAGVVTMEPEQKVLADIKSGTAENAKNVNNILAEAADILVGAWNRALPEESDALFVQTGTFLADSWDKLQEKMVQDESEELLLIPYEITIVPYPAFKCGVIFPGTTFDGASAADSEQDPAPEPTEQAEESTDKEIEAEEPGTIKESPGEEAGQAQGVTEDDAAVRTFDKKRSEQPAEDSKANAVKKTKSAKKKHRTKKAGAKAKPEHTGEQSPGNQDTKDNGVEEKAPTTNKDKKKPISGTIQKMARSAAALPGEADLPAETKNTAVSETPSYLTITAKEIMQKDIHWCSQDISVQQAMAQMQQHDTPYTLVGSDGTLEGMISKSDLMGALSPYLRPEFARWRRRLDDATLQIKIKWIMTRSIRTIRPETPLADIMENMQRLTLRALPVADQNGKVQGLVTIFDIFRALLKSDSNAPDTESLASQQPLE